MVLATVFEKKNQNPNFLADTSWNEDSGEIL